METSSINRRYLGGRGWKGRRIIFPEEEDEENGLGEERVSEDELNLREEEETHECAIAEDGRRRRRRVEAYPINGGDCEWKRDCGV